MTLKKIVLLAIAAMSLAAFAAPSGASAAAKWYTAIEEGGEGEIEHFGT